MRDRIITANDKIRQHFSELSEIVRTIAYLTIFFYISQIIWPYILVPFSNPDQIFGSLSKIQFSPLNNSLRYIVTLFIVFGGYIFISLLPDRHKKWFMRVFFITVLAVSFLLTAFIRPDNQYFVDLFHDGYQIGSAALLLQGRQMYTGIITLHGPLNDTFLAVSSFWLFGKSIGSVYLLTSLIHLITFTLFFLLLMLVIKSELIFYLASVWFFNLVTVPISFQRMNFVVSTMRDITVWIMLLFLWFLVGKKWNSILVLFFIGFTAGFAYFVSLDRAYLLTLITVFLFIYRMIVSQHKKEDGQIFFQHGLHIKSLFINLKNNVPLAVGFLLGFFIQLPILGIRAFGEFLQFTFKDFPKIAPFYGEQIFPGFSENPASWIPIFFIIFNGVFIFHQFFLPKFKEKKFAFELNTQQLYIFLVFVLSIIFFKAGIFRNDYFHLLYGSTVVFLVTFLIIHYIYQQSFESLSYSWFKGIKNLIITGIILYGLFSYNVPLTAFADVKQFPLTYLTRQDNCPIDKKENREVAFRSVIDTYVLNHLRCPPYRKEIDIKNFFLLNKRSDREWLTDYSNKLLDYINNNTTEKDYVFIFNNESGYYYFLKAKSPTRFSDLTMAASSKYRELLIDDLAKNPPKLILYSTSSWPEVLEGVSMKERFSYLNDWILKNYPYKTNINTAVILSRENLSPASSEVKKEETLKSTPSATPKIMKILPTKLPTVTPAPS